jgi:GTP pyrophosphokinase
MMEHKEEMIFVKWTRNAPHRYTLIVSIENRRGSLASFLAYLAKMQVNLVTIELGKSEEGHADYFEMSIELPEGVDSEQVRENIKERYKLIEFVSARDAYK